MAVATDPELRGVLRRPFAEQVAFFRGKLGNLIPTRTWRDVLREGHDAGFMVAGAQSADLLADLAAAVDRAITDGESLDGFRARFDEIVARNGWTGWTGEGSRAGRAWRTRTIYRTNLLTSYAAGRHAQLQSFPIWIYRHGGSREPRPEHLAWDGLALPREHPFWRTHYPPSAWGCSCYVIGAASAEAARRLGGDPGRQPPPGWDVRRTDGTLPGVDEGWDYAPGASVAARTAEAAARKTVAWPYEIGKAFQQAVPEAQRDALAEAIRRQPETGEALRRFAEAALGVRRGAPVAPRGEGYVTLGLLTRAQSELAARLTGVEAIAAQRWDWTVDASAIRHVAREHGGSAEALRGQVPVAAEDYATLPMLVSRGAARRVDDGGRSLVRIEMVRDGILYVALFEPRVRRRMLALVTLWKRRAPDPQRP